MPAVPVEVASSAADIDEQYYQGKDNKSWDQDVEKPTEHEQLLVEKITCFYNHRFFYEAA